ncbi:MAG: flagellar motor protein MotB [Alphaproteobacteria bacterium]|nr:flagellar motor protein MotB [Alphaproteobacteria bacterium]
MSKRYKRRRRRADHGTDDWLMTYADMITLLLCFFAIFLSVSVPKEDQMEKAKQEVLEHFASPDKVHGDVLPRVDASGNPRDNVPYDALPSIVDQFHTGQGQSVGDGVDAGEGQSEGMGEGTRDGVSDYDEYGREVVDGDRIQIIDMPSAAFFASGSADLSEEGKQLLRNMRTNSLAAEELQGFQITVEGHTDDIPINTLQFPSNWELSTSRAAAVVRYLIELGIPAERLRVAGYADVFPKVPNSNSENRAQNRRVVMKLEKLERR